jgi:hypothetical protein
MQFARDYAGSAAAQPTSRSGAAGRAAAEREGDDQESIE